MKPFLAYVGQPKHIYISIEYSVVGVPDNLVGYPHKY